MSELLDYLLSGCWGMGHHWRWLVRGRTLICSQCQKIKRVGRLGPMRAPRKNPRRKAKERVAKWHKKPGYGVAWVFAMLDLQELTFKWKLRAQK